METTYTSQLMPIRTKVIYSMPIKDKIKSGWGDYGTSTTSDMFSLDLYKFSNYLTPLGMSPVDYVKKYFSISWTNSGEQYYNVTITGDGYISEHQIYDTNSNTAMVNPQFVPSMTIDISSLNQCYVQIVLKPEYYYKDVPECVATLVIKDTTNKIDQTAKITFKKPNAIVTDQYILRLVDQNDANIIDTVNIRNNNVSKYEYRVIFSGGNKTNYEHYFNEPTIAGEENLLQFTLPRKFDTKIGESFRTITGYVELIEKANPTVSYQYPIRIELGSRDKIEAETEVTCSFSPNGGTGEMKDIKVKLKFNFTTWGYEGVITLPECTYTAPVGYVFKHWMDGNGDKIELRDAKEKINVTENKSYSFTALWDEKPKEEGDTTKPPTTDGTTTDSTTGNTDKIDGSNTTLNDLNKVPEDKCNCPENDDSTGVTAKPIFIVPPVGTRGTFKFKKPFNNKMYDGLEYEVRAIRSLVEMKDSDEKPYENIYVPVELTEKDFKQDVDHGVPIIVFINTAGNYYYVPASYLLSMPKTSGVKYQQVMMAVNLGYLPIDYDPSLIKSTLVDDVKAILGITSTVETIKTSAVYLISEEEHQSFQKLLNGNKSITHSYRVRYAKVLEENNKYRERLKLLTNCLTNHIQKGLQANRPPVYKDIVFNANGGIGKMDSQNVLVGNYSIPACLFVAPNGKRFDHWNDKQDDTGTSYKAYSRVYFGTDDEITLYAIWKDLNAPEVEVEENTPKDAVININPDIVNLTNSDTAEIKVVIENASAQQLKLTWAGLEDKIYVTFKNVISSLATAVVTLKKGYTGGIPDGSTFTICNGDKTVHSKPISIKRIIPIQINIDKSEVDLSVGKPKEAIINISTDGITIADAKFKQNRMEDKIKVTFKNEKANSVDAIVSLADGFNGEIANETFNFQTGDGSNSSLDITVTRKVEPTTLSVTGFKTELTAGKTGEDTTTFKVETNDKNYSCENTTPEILELNMGTNTIKALKAGKGIIKVKATAEGSVEKVVTIEITVKAAPPPEPTTPPTTGTGGSGSGGNTTQPRT